MERVHTSGYRAEWNQAQPELDATQRNREGVVLLLRVGVGFLGGVAWLFGGGEALPPPRRRVGSTSDAAQGGIQRSKSSTSHATGRASYGRVLWLIRVLPLCCRVAR